MPARTVANSASTGLPDGMVDELTFLAAWEGGLATSIGAYLRIRQLRRAYPSLLVECPPAASIYPPPTPPN